ncbi:unnamed protein product [Caenorhabditis angaria]|uniref:Uncharacterized protein n=1 Tax=Caenorhabditis angaria TaxID=860376 RepID=A0A9P1IPL4_9PELO|nr:unnamed protein product [Caenorhabditis angaria]
MSDANPERGIIFSTSAETFFVATSNDEVLMRKNEWNRDFKMGDCINILSTNMTLWKSGSERHMKRNITNCVKIEDFLDWKPQNNRNGVLITTGIVDLQMRNHPISNILVRCFQTPFLEEVYDSEISKTIMYSEREMMKMRIVAVHIGSNKNSGYWAVLDIVNSIEMNRVKRNSYDGRNLKKGICLEATEYRSKNGRNDIYLWIPNRRERITFPEELRGPADKMKFFGNWVKFTVNSNNRMDEYSDVQIIEDVLPTRFFKNRYEIKVLVDFDVESWNGKGYPEISSTHCGLIADVTDTLRFYKKLNSFSGEAWVHYFPHEPTRGIRFVLSEKQEHWDEESGIQDGYGRRERSRPPTRNNGSYGNSTDFNRRERSRQRKEEEFEHSDLRRPRSVSRKPSHPPEQENDSDDSWDQEANRRSRMREYSRPPMRSPERSNYRDNFDRRRERSRTREDFDIVDQRNREYERRSRETSRPPSRKKDDTNSIPSTSRSYNDDLSKVQTNLKKLKTRYEYLTANNMPIPEKLREDLGNAIAEEIRLKKNNQDQDDRKSGSSRVEVDEEDLQKYKELVVMFREMLSSQEVCEEMRRFDEIAMDNINQLLFDLMVDQNPERGIIVGSASETIFIITSNEEVIMRQNDRTRNLEMGDCLHILSTSTTNWRNPAGFQEVRRVVENFEKVPAFVEWKYQSNRKGIIIMANIIDVRMLRHPETNQFVRCFRTDFMEEVYDSDLSRTENYTERELMKMKIVTMRTVTKLRQAYWALIDVQRNDPDNVGSTEQFRNRTLCNGIALKMSEQHSRNGRNDIYFWIPYRRDQVVFKEHLRGNIPKNKFIGTWVTFTLNSSYQMDEFSDVKFVNDIFPTRFFANRCEVKVSVNFDKNTWKQGCYPEMMSQQCSGIVVDLTGTLEKYGMLKSFNGQAWVHYFPHEPTRGIKFVLSEKQEHWDEEPGNDGFRSQGRSRSPRNNGSYGNSTDFNRRERSRARREKEFEQRRSRSVSRKPSHQPAEENDSDDSWDQEVNRKSRMREYSRPPMRSPERSNYRENFDRRRERSRPREDFDIVDQRNREYERRSRETSRAPSRKRDDTSSIPSTSRSYNDDLSKAQANLKKLKTRYEYLTANNMPIPEKLREDLGNAIAEEIRLKKNIQDQDDRKSGSSRKNIYLEKDFDIVDQRNREYERRSRETSRPPMKHENEREKSRPREDFDIVDQRNREYEKKIERNFKSTFEN